MVRQGREFWVVLVVVVLTVCLSSHSDAFNLSPRPNRQILDPQFATSLPKVRASYFGFTMSLRPNG